MTDAPARILLLEDNEHDAELTLALLTEGKPNGPIIERQVRLTDAVQALAKGKFDCVLADLNLPDSEGVATVTALAGTGACIVAMTGSVDPDIGMAAVEAGAEDFVSKSSIDGRRLRQVIEFAVQRRKTTAAASAKPIRVLLLEDNPNDERLTRAYLEGGSFEVESVVRVSDAIALLDKKPFDAVLADLNVPDSQGADTIAKLAAHARAPPVLAFTSSPDPGLGHATVEAGGEDFLPKATASAQNVRRALEFAVQRRRGRRSPSERLQTRLEALVLARTRSMSEAIAELKDREAALKTANAKILLALSRFETLAENLPALVFIAEPESGRIMYASRGFERTFGRSVEQLQTNPTLWSECVVPEDLPIAKAPLTVLKPGETTTVRFRVMWPDASTHVLEAVLVNVQTPGDSNNYLMGITRDITPELAREQELRGAKDKAEAALGAKSRFLATMSHELRTPLNAVIGLASLMSESPPEAASKENLTTILHSADHLLNIINDILDYSKLEAEKMPVTKAPASPWQPLIDAVTLMSASAKDKGLALVSAPAEPGMPEAVEIDAGKVRQVLLNLIGNAVKFTETGTIEGKVTYSNGSLEYAIADTGPGIPAEHRPRLFEPFYQAHAEAGTSRGTGLGLAINRRLVETMGGSIWFDTGAQGSTFRFRIPAAPVKATPAAANGGPTLPPLSILLVEDNVVNRQVAVKMLERLGMHPDVARDGVEAVEAAGKRTYDVILMDIAMPRLDGFGATAQIRRIPAAPRPPRIIAMTAFTSNEDRARATEAGMDDFVSKPFRLQELRAVLAKAA